MVYLSVEDVHQEKSMTRYDLDRFISFACCEQFSEIIQSHFVADDLKVCTDNHSHHIMEESVALYMVDI